ncbi:MAG TPA: BtpA/SgcQ family protein [Dehalococcoidia bacterium]|nr:BtpA/SgcQ family protein [Dehalococcoidia bacterium]
MSFRDVFPRRLPIIGMVHLLPLPGSPRWGGDMEAVLRRALEDATTLAQEGVDGLLVENYGDLPFMKGSVGHETVAAMAVAVRAVVEATGLPVGVNVLRNDPCAALAVACAAGAQFVRTNVHIGAVVADQGLLEGRAAEALRYRRWLGCQRVLVLADVTVKHGSALGERGLEQVAQDVAYRGLADGLIVSGEATGRPPTPQELARVRQAVPDRPLLVGSGLDPGNAGTLLPLADGAIVGTAFKEGGRTEAPVQRQRVRRLLQAVQQVRAALP